MRFDVDFKALLPGEWLLTREGKTRPMERVLINNENITRYGSPGRLEYCSVWNGIWSVAPDGRGPEYLSLSFTVQHFGLGSTLEGMRTTNSAIAAWSGLLPITKLGMFLNDAAFKHIENSENAAIRAGRRWTYPLLSYSSESIRMIAGRRWQTPETGDVYHTWTMTKKGA